MSTAALRADAKVIGLVGTAHSLSHFYQLVVPPLFLLLKDEFDASFAALGFCVTMFYVLSGFLQTPAGFAVDRVGGKIVLVAGLALSSLGIMLIAFAPTYPMLVLGFAVAGAGNSVFHPADLAILNARVGTARLGHAFSAHGFGGSIGWMFAPLYSIAASASLGWRGALALAGAVGLLAALMLAAQSVLRMDAHMRSGHADKSTLAGDLRLLGSREVLLCAAFFTFSSVALVGLQTFSLPTIVSLYAVSQQAASGMLTGFLVGGAAGMLFGGFVASRIRRHDLAAIAGVMLSMIFVVLLAAGAAPPVLLAVEMTLAGFFLSAVSPSRDILARAVTPPGARGKVYGFVYSGLDLGASIAPSAFGWFLDHRQPRLVFLSAALALLVCTATLALLRKSQS